MADGMFNIARGRVGYYGTLPATSDSLILELFRSAQSDALLVGHDDLAAVKAANTVCNFTNYARKSITTVTMTVDDAVNRASLDIADQVWTNAGGTTDNTIVKAVLCYSTSGAADSAIVPLLHFDVGITTNGDDVTISFNEEGLWRSE